MTRRPWLLGALLAWGLVAPLAPTGLAQAAGDDEAGAARGGEAPAVEDTPPPSAQPASLLDLTPEEVLGLTQRAPLEPIPDRQAMRASLGRGVAYLLSSQEPDGSWGSTREPADAFWSNIHTHRAWIAATTGLVLTALLEAGDDEAALAAVDRAVDFLTGADDLKRPSDWDTDHTWGFLYSLAGVNAALRHPRYAAEPRHAALLALADRCVEGLAATQSPDGGWGYYDLDGTTRRPSWATSFQTAAALVELIGARAHGVAVDDKLLAAARRALERCRLPSGAYTYSVDAIPSPGRATWINAVQGSLSRIQVCNLALALSGSTLVGSDELKAGLDQFFEHHRFLDVARGKPVPHEAYYYNSGYFYFFGHYYAARVLELLNPAEQVPYRGRLAREIVKCQEADGSMWDYYINTYHRPYGTAFGAMTLVRTLGREDD